MVANWIEARVYEAVVRELLITPPLSEPVPLEKLQFTPEGARHDSHAGFGMNATIRETNWTNRGAWVLNYRQLALTSIGETAIVAEKLGLAEITAGDLMSNIHFEGLANLSEIPAGSFITFYSPNGERKELVLFTTGINNPCEVVQARIERRLGKGVAKGYVKASMRLRGVTAMVWQAGILKIGDKAFITTPTLAIPE